MNAIARVIILGVCLAACTAGLMSASRQQCAQTHDQGQAFDSFEFLSSYQFAASDLHKFSFKQLEAAVRADAIAKSPRARIEFGSVKVERGALVIPVVIMSPNGEKQAFLYKLVPQKDSWKVDSAQRLWFVSPAHLIRGLRV